VIYLGACRRPDRRVCQEATGTAAPAPGWGAYVARAGNVSTERGPGGLAGALIRPPINPGGPPEQFGAAQAGLAQAHGSSAIDPGRAED